MALRVVSVTMCSSIVALDNILHTFRDHDPVCANNRPWSLESPNANRAR